MLGKRFTILHSEISTNISLGTQSKENPNSAVRKGISVVIDQMRLLLLLLILYQWKMMNCQLNVYDTDECIAKYDTCNTFFSVFAPVQHVVEQKKT